MTFWRWVGGWDGGWALGRCLVAFGWDELVTQDRIMYGNNEMVSWNKKRIMESWNKALKKGPKRVWRTLSEKRKMEDGTTWAEYGRGNEKNTETRDKDIFAFVSEISFLVRITLEKRCWGMSEVMSWKKDVRVKVFSQRESTEPSPVEWWFYCRSLG